MKPFSNDHCSTDPTIPGTPPTSGTSTTSGTSSTLSTGDVVGIALGVVFGVVLVTLVIVLLVCRYRRKKRGGHSHGWVSSSPTEV